MLLFQCHNVLMEDNNVLPDVDAVSEDGCRTGAGFENLHAACREVLFSWGPGSEGEMIEGNRGILPLEVREK